MIPGDGIGPEVVAAAKRCVDVAGEKHGFDVAWEGRLVGEEAKKREGSILPEDTLESIGNTHVALKGPVTTPIGKGFRSLNVALRQEFDLYANVRPAKLFEGVPSRFSDVNLVVIRENTEDLYSGLEFRSGAPETRELATLVKSKLKKSIAKNSAVSLKVITPFASRRIARFAFEFAKAKKRKKVTAVHKANILKFTDGLFLESARGVSKDYRGIMFEDKIVDNLAMQLVTKPERYDVLLCPNLYGDIISDLCAGLVGGLGLAPSANIGSGGAIFEPVHGSAPAHAGKNDANPTASILSAAMMLDYLGEMKAAKDLESAVLRVIKEGKKVTYDLKPKKPAGTREMTAEIVKKLIG